MAVICVSGPTDPDMLDRGLAVLDSLGLKPEVLPSAQAASDTFAYLAGDDQLRAADLAAALADPSYSAVFCARGGYGAQRVLELIDWSMIDRSRPRAVIGFSDVTALLEAIAVKLNWASYFGPMPTSPSFLDDTNRYARDALTRMLFLPESVHELVFPDCRTIVPGIAQGTTIGGTASILAASLGTDTSLPARDAILFLEDVGELPYRLDRILTQLRRSGYLEGVAGILLGTFTDCGDPAFIDRLVADRLGDLGVPIMSGADIGHGVPLQTYPIGVQACLDTERGTLTIAH